MKASNEGKETSKAENAGDESQEWLLCQPLDEVEQVPVEWLWQPYIPAAKVTLLDGDPGEGKSYIGLWLTAQITSGKKLPGATTGHRVGKVLILSAEDDPADTLKPRLTAMGANCSRVTYIAGVRSYKHGDSSLAFDEHLALLEERIREMRPRLVIVDPLVAYLSRKTDLNKANHIRAVFGPLARIAATYGCSILVIRHLNKSESTKAIYKGLGSIDFVAAVRSALMVARHQGLGVGDERVMFHYKANSTAKGPALGYRITDAGLEWTGEKPGLVLDDLVTGGIADARGSIDEAQDFLEDLLGHHQLRAREVLEQAKEAGIPRNALERAKKALGIRSCREGGAAAAGYWVWQLPVGSGAKARTDS